MINISLVKLINILRAAFVPKLQSQTVSKEKFGKTLLYERAAHKINVDDILPGSISSTFYLQLLLS